jgi:hypothetical protein
MGLFAAPVQECFCAFCKSSRRVYTKRGNSLFNIFAGLMGAVGISYILFQGWDPRGIFIFLGFLAVSEIFLRVRWRIAMTCRHCGFDPVLYLKDVNSAVQKVQRRLDARRVDPGSMLAAPLNLPQRKVPKKKPETLKEEAMRLALQRKNAVTPSSAAALGGVAKGQIVSKQL